MCCRGQVTSHHADGPGAIADSKAQAERSFSWTDRINFNSNIQLSRVLQGTANFAPCRWTWGCSRLKVAAEQSCSKTDKINFTTVYSSYVCCREQITSHHTDGPGAIADSKSQAERSFSRTDRINFNSSIQFSRVLKGADNFTPYRWALGCSRLQVYRLSGASSKTVRTTTSKQRG